MVDSLQDL